MKKLIYKEIMLAMHPTAPIFLLLSAMLLPVRKREVVKARFALVVGLELCQMAVAVPFAAVRQHMGLPGNQVGMDANIPLFGLAFVMLGLFHLVFFGIYYQDVRKVGKAFVVSSAVIFLYIGAAETLTHILPFLRDHMDTSDPRYLGEKLIFLLAGAALYLVMTLAAFYKAVRDFEGQDL